MTAELSAPDTMESMSDEDLFALTPYNGDDLEKFEKRTNPRYTAERVRVNEPMRYETIRRSLMEGQTIGIIRRTHQCGNGLIYAIIDSMPGGREAYRARCVGKLEDLAHMAADLLLEKLPDEKDAKTLAVVMGIAAERAALLKGMPSAVIEVRHSIDTKEMEEFNGRLRAMREAKGRTVDGETGGLESLATQEAA